MGKKAKKLKVQVDATTDLPDDPSIETEGTIGVDEPAESTAQEQDEVASSSHGDEGTNAPVDGSEDYQKEFTVIGQEEFVDPKRILVTSSWVSAATVFPAGLDVSHLAALETVAGVPPKIHELCHTALSSWFPVQSAVLPTLISELNSPSILRPRDIAIAAPTGSGKTLCYVLPCLVAAGMRPRGQPIAVVVVPVQALVHQVEKEFARFNGYGANVFAMSGKEEYSRERSRLIGPKGKAVADIIIATPNRLIRHLMDETGDLDISRIRFLVADEADRMGSLLRWEWLEAVELRAGGIGAVRAPSLHDVVRSRCAPRKILLSATLSKDVEELHAWNLHRPRLFRATAAAAEEMKAKNVDHVSGVLALPSSIEHKLTSCSLQFHPLFVFKQVAASDWKRVLVFTNQRQAAFRLCHVVASLAGDAFKVEQLTADLFGNRRAKVLKRFMSGTTRVLICSDVLSRGIDVPQIDAVINYDLPSDDRLFVHRAGRTARAGASGTLLTVTEKGQKRDFKFMLEKNGLWKNSNEITLEDKEFEEDSQLMSKYKEALTSLKAVAERNGEQKNKKVNLQPTGAQKRKFLQKRRQKQANGAQQLPQNGQGQNGDAKVKRDF